MTDFEYPVRLPIAYEGLATTDGRMILPGGFEWDATAALPLMLRQVHGARLIGRVVDLRREPEGVITAMLTCAPVGMGPAIECTDTDEIDRSTTASMLITRARIRAVALTPDPAWPSLLITDETEEWR